MHSLWSIKGARDLLLVGVLALFGLAWAVGPVPITGLPGGGVELSDSDLGNGQAWGRGSGRQIVYRMNNQSQYTALTFGIAGGTAPSLAFDGNASAAGEIMSFNGGLSNLPAGLATFSGVAGLNVWTGSSYQGVIVATRFELRLTRVSNGAPIPLVFDGSGVSPGGDVHNVGDIRVNLLFLMQDPFNGAMFPALDRYDLLPTPPGPTPPNAGPVMTGVSTGFYYTLPTSGGMTLEQHDAHLTAEMNIVKADLSTLKTKVGFIHEDWPLRWNGIQGQVQGVQATLDNQIRPTLDQIRNDVAQLLGQGNGGTSDLAKRSDIDGLKEMLMILWGLGPCPLSPAECAQVKFIQGLASTSELNARADGILIGLNNALAGVATSASVSALSAKVGALEDKIDELQATVDNSAAASLDVRAVQVDSGDPKKLRWLVKTTRDGVLVNASLTRMATVRGYSNMANVMDKATVSSLGTGMHDVVLSISKESPEGVAYLFEATLIIGPSDVVGSALVVTEKKGASPF